MLWDNTTIAPEAIGRFNYVYFMRALFGCGLLLWPLSGWADDLRLPLDAVQTQTRTLDETLHDLPTGPWNLQIPTIGLQGVAQQSVYTLPTHAGVRRIAHDMSKQLADAGYEVIFECQDTACGGFDFRFGLNLIPPPDMFVDLSFFSFASLLQPNGQAAMLLVSQSYDNIYLHLTFIRPSIKPDEPETQTTPIIGQDTKSLSHILDTVGRYALDDLTFAPGAARLTENAFHSLAELAEYLSANPHRTITLVGHTDATGSRTANLTLSQERARTVRAVLTHRYGIDAGRIEADGVGDLVPRASNATDEGRRLNRRVEVIIRAAE